MPRPRTGSVEPLQRADGRTYYRARIRLGDGTRARVDVPSKYSTPAGGRTGAERAALYAQALQEREDETGVLLAQARKKQEAAKDDASQGETVQLWSERWLASRVARGLASVLDDRSRLEHHVLPALGALPIAAVTRPEIERLVEDLDRKIRLPKGHPERISWRTAAHAWSLVTTMAHDACASKRRDLRVRDDNPAAGVEGPDRGEKKGKQYLWPSEFLQLVSSPAVPVRWARLFALAVYTYTRAGELEALDWGDVHLEHGYAHVHRSVDRVRDKGTMRSTKTGVARRVPIEPELRPLMQLLREEAGGRGSVFDMPSAGVLSAKLRHYLKRAGVERAELFASDETRKAITFHDLRATGITWMAVRGDEPLRIMQRAGHTSFETTQGYIREAENLRAGFGTVFPPLPTSRLAHSMGQVTRLVPKSSMISVELTGIETFVVISQ